jgi:hypothetical protein
VSDLPTRAGQIPPLQGLGDTLLHHLRNPIFFWLYQSKHGGLRQIVDSITNSCVFALTFAARASARTSS